MLCTIAFLNHHELFWVFMTFCGAYMTLPYSCQAENAYFSIFLVAVGGIGRLCWAGELKLIHFWLLYHILLTNLFSLSLSALHKSPLQISKELAGGIYASSIPYRPFAQYIRKPNMIIGFHKDTGDISGRWWQNWEYYIKNKLDTFIESTKDATRM